MHYILIFSTNHSQEKSSSSPSSQVYEEFYIAKIVFVA